MAEPRKPARSTKKSTGRKPGRPRKTAKVEEPEAPTQEVEAETLPTDMGFDFTALIDILVPPATIDIVDAFGNEHKLVTAIPARSQIQMFRIIEELQQAPAFQSVLATGFGDGNIASVLMFLGSDEKVMSCIAEAFEIAHPQAYATAYEAGKEMGLDVQDAADCFAVEELVSAIVPLFLRLVKRTAQAANVMQEAQEQTN